MPNTYTQLYTHIVFTVKGRYNLIPSNHREDLQKYITGIIQNKNCKVMAIYANPDHIHIFVSMSPEISVSSLVREIKANSSRWINNKNWFKTKFAWQEGFGAFSNSKSQLSGVVKYILNQKEHHKKRTFKKEYLEFLEKYGVEYDEKYLFEWIDTDEQDK